MDSKHDDGKDKIKNQVDSNKNNTHDETKLGSQMGSVNHFGVHNNKQDEEDKENIRNKIDATKKRQLQENGNIQYIPNFGDTLGDVPSNNGADYSLSDDESKDPVAGAVSGASNIVDGAKNLKNGASKVKEGAKNLLNKGSKKTGEAGLNAAGKGLEAAGKSAAKGVEGATKAAQGIGKIVGTASKAVAAVVSKIIAFITSLFGMPLLIILGVFALIIVIIVLIHIIISSYGQKFGIDGSNIEEFLREANVEKIEGLTRDEVDQMLEGYVCKLTWWDKVRNFFGAPDLSDPCVNLHLIKKELENREKNGDRQDRHGRTVTVKTSDELAPGYFFATSYYAYDSQNLDENGEHYIPLVTSGHTVYNDDGEELFTDIITDLDVITTLLNTKKLDTCTGTDKDGNPTGCEPIYTIEEIKELLDNYIFFEDHHNDDPNHGEGPYTDEYGYKWGFPYWLYQYIIVGYDENENPIWDWACVQQVPETYYTDELKFKLYLRYGENVMAEYERDKNWNLQWQKTSGECKSWSGWTKWANGDLEEHGSVSLDAPPDMSKYNKKANPDTTADDNAKVTLESGITYGYDSGFMYNTYPRYDENYITVKRDYDYKIDKEIERIIQTIDSRQDYTNYFLGYESDVAQYIAGINNGSYSYNGGAKCTFDIGGAEVSDIKVRLLHARKNDAIPSELAGKPIEGQELIDFDKYIMGVVYAESGGNPTEALKVQAIAAASYILSSYKIKNENGVNVIEISNSTFEQTYCDPDKGCYTCLDSNYENNHIVTLLTQGTVPQGAKCNSNPRGALPSDHAIRGAVKAVSGQVLKDASGNIVRTGYGQAQQNKWKELANSGLDYVEIIRQTYGSEYQLSDPDCTYGVTGEWAEWKQYSETWANVPIGSSTVGKIGCFMTCHAMVIAAGADNILIPNFNPGTFAQYLSAHGGFSGNNLYSDRALDLAVGPGNWESRPINLNGSYNYKVSQIASLLEEGYQVILRVKTPASNAINGKGDQHYVVVTGISGSDIIMADPASNYTKVLDYYINEGISWAKGIKFK